MAKIEKNEMQKQKGSKVKKKVKNSFF